MEATRGKHASQTPDLCLPKEQNLKMMWDKQRGFGRSWQELAGVKESTKLKEGNPVHRRFDVLAVFMLADAIKFELP